MVLNGIGGEMMKNQQIRNLVFGTCHLVQGLVMILSAGFYNPEIALKFAIYLHRKEQKNNP